MNQALWLVTPRAAEAAVASLGSSLWQWCYVGVSPAKRERFTQRLSLARRLSVGEELNRVAQDLRQPFVEWIAAIGARQRRQATWWSGRAASRSPIQTHLFLLTCYAHLVVRWASRLDTFEGVRLVIVDDSWLFRSLRRALRTTPGVRLIGRGIVAASRDAARNLLWMPVTMGYALVWGLASAAVARWCFPRPIEDAFNQDGSTTLLFTWVIPGGFASPGRFHDPYTGRLEELLIRAGQRVLRCTPLQVGIRRGLVRRLRPLASQWLVTPRALHPGDVVRTSFSRWTIDGLREVPPLQGLDCRLLLWREVLQEWGSLEASGYELWYRTMKRVARRVGHRIAVLVYPFENKPWEKLLCLAFREDAPHVRLIGYQHASLTPMLLDHCLGLDEASWVPLPDRIVTNGPLALSLLRDGGFPSDRLLDGGAFRYEYLLGREPSLTTRVRTTPTTRRILVALSLSEPQSALLLQELLELFPQPVLDGTVIPLQWIVKAHPELPVSRLLPRSRSLPPWFTVSTQPLGELLADADLMVYAPPTSGRWEAAAAGVPTVRYVGDWLDLDGLAGIDGERLTVCARGEILSTLVKLLSQPEAPAPVPPTPLVRRVFSPVDERVWSDLVRGC